MRAGRELRRLVIARIEDQVADLRDKVFDQATDDVAYPYCTLGTSDWRKEDADCIGARVWSLQIDIWHRRASKGAVEDLTDDVAEALDGFLTDDMAMHPIEVMLARVLDDPSGDLHGVVQIEVMVEGT